jgi:hypothetical protein
LLSFLKAVDVPVPDLPLIDIPGIPDRITIRRTTQKVPYLGHAGAAFFDGRKGTTKYYEYGRYDVAARGLVRKISMPDVTLKSGRPTASSLLELLRAISNSSGQRGPILGAYIELEPMSFAKMFSFCQTRLAANSNPHRKPYDLFSNSCCHFMRDVADAGGASIPPVVPPQPSGYIRVVRAGHPTLDYSLSGGLVVPLLGFSTAAPAAARGAHP